MAQFKLNKKKFVKELEADPEFAAYCKSIGLLNRSAPVKEKSSIKPKEVKSKLGDK